MKKVLLLIVIFSVVVKGISQLTPNPNNTFPCINNVSTSPLNPTNNNLPPVNPNFYLNSTQWYGFDQGGLLIQLPTNNMVNLIDAFGNPETMVNPYSDQQMGYYEYIFGSETPVFENGWELLSVNLGFFANGTTFASQNFTSEFSDLPYLILYNRYKGIIRVFANSGDGVAETANGWNAVQVELQYSDENNYLKTGLFRLSDGFDKALDQQTTAVNLVSFAEHPNAYRKWFSCDFQIAYDPCVCYYPSKLRLSFDFIRSSTLKLQGRAIAVESDLINGSFVNEKDYLSNFKYDGTGADGGMIMYKTIDQLVNDYLNKMDAYKTELEASGIHNEKVERNLAIINMFKDAVLGGLGGAIDTFVGTPLFDKFEEFAGDLINKDSLDLSGLAEEAKRELTSQVNTFIGDKFKKQPTPNKPNSPTATFTEMYFEGALNTNFQVGGPTFYTPGTFGNGPLIGGTNGTPINGTVTSPHQYPIYNEAMGVFALLESPKLNVAELLYVTSQYDFDIVQQVTNTCQGYSSPTGIVHSTKINDITTQSLQFKLSEPLKFVFNPALDIKSKDIKVAIVARVKRNEVLFPELDQTYSGYGTAEYDSIRTFMNPQFSGNVKSFEVNSMQDMLPNASILDSMSFQTPFIPIDAFMNVTGGIAFDHNIYYKLFTDMYAYSTNSQVFNCEGLNRFGTQNLPQFANANRPYTINELIEKFELEIEFELKVLVDVVFNSISQILTYKIEDTNIDVVSNFFDNNLGSQSLNVLPENLVFTDTYFDGNQISGCELTGSLNDTYYCKCWNNIKIDGDIDVASGYRVYFQAGNEIYVTNNSEINPEAQMYITPVLNYSIPMPEATPSYVGNFCKGLNSTGQNYQANFSKNQTPDISSEEGPEEEKPFTVLNFNLYPNPTKDAATVSYNVTEFAEVTIQVTDLMGRIVIEPQMPTMQDMGNYEVQMNTSSLSKGIYLCSVKVGNQIKTKRLIIQ
jgi:hypothetical protein